MKVVMLPPHQQLPRGVEFLLLPGSAHRLHDGVEPLGGQESGLGRGLFAVELLARQTPGNGGGDIRPYGTG